MLSIIKYLRFGGMGAAVLCAISICPAATKADPSSTDPKAVTSSTDPIAFTVTLKVKKEYTTTPIDEDNVANAPIVYRDSEVTISPKGSSTWSPKIEVSNSDDPADGWITTETSERFKHGTTYIVKFRNIRHASSNNRYVRITPEITTQGDNQGI